MADSRGKLRNPVAEVRREPADHDLVCVLVPEEVDPHAVAAEEAKNVKAELEAAGFPPLTIFRMQQTTEIVEEL